MLPYGFVDHHPSHLHSAIPIHSTFYNTYTFRISYLRLKMPNHWWIPKSVGGPTSSSGSTGPPAEAPAGEVINYGERQELGGHYRRWISNPSKPNCPVQPNQLTILGLGQQFNVEIWQETPANPDLINLFQALQLIPATFPHDQSAYRSYEFNSFLMMSWRAFVGPRVLIIEEMHRSDTRMPYVSEVSLAVYGSDYLLDTLRHVIITSVVNQETLSCLSTQVHSNVYWSDDWWRTWEHGTPEYDTLLGTPVGKMVASMVLGGFPRGTKKISCINTVSNWDGLTAHFHFEIAPGAVEG